MKKDLSIFETLVKLVDRERVMDIAQTHDSDYYTKTLDTWGHLIALVYCQLTEQESLRDWVINFNQQTPLLNRLGINEIARSTLSDANNHRTSQVFKAIFTTLLPYVCRKYRQFLKEGIYLLDATPIPLQAKLFDWIMTTKRIKGLKTHVLYELQSGAPIYFSITQPNVNDIEEAKKLMLRKKTTYVFDRGYYDFEWWNEISEKGSRFVTRSKKSLVYKTIESNDSDTEDIKRDQLIELKGRSGDKYAGYLRLVEVEVEIRGKKKRIQLLSNDVLSSADEIVELYRLRWQIELFFKWMKSHLKIKKFLGRSRTAVETQIIVAFIAYILLRITYDELRVKVSLKQFLSIIKYNIGQKLSACTILKYDKSRKKELFRAHEEIKYAI